MTVSRTVAASELVWRDNSRRVTFRLAAGFDSDFGWGVVEIDPGSGGGEANAPPLRVTLEPKLRVRIHLTAKTRRVSGLQATTRFRPLGQPSGVVVSRDAVANSSPPVNPAPGAPRVIPLEPARWLSFATSNSSRQVVDTGVFEIGVPFVFGQPEVVIRGDNLVRFKTIWPIDPDNGPCELEIELDG